MPSSNGSSQPRDRIQLSHIAGTLYRLSHQGREEEYVVMCKHIKHVLLLLIRIFMWTIFKVLIFAIVTMLLMFYALVFGHEACGILASQSGIEPAPPALESEVSTTGPPGKSPEPLILNDYRGWKALNISFSRQFISVEENYHVNYPKTF